MNFTRVSASFIVIMCTFLATLAHKEYHLIDGLSLVFIDDEAEHIGHTWSGGSVYERHLIQKFYHLLPREEPFVALDIGAQTGCFSLMAKFFPNSQWYAFEPIIEAATVLKKNLALNGIDNVHVENVAVSDISGTTYLSMPNKDNWGLSTIGSNPLRFAVQSQREVSCIDLDSFVGLHGIKKVHFMKLDTEGAELLILRGAKNMLLRDHPIIVMEYNETNMKQCGITKNDVDAFLMEMGYVWGFISSEDLLCTPKG